MLNQALSTAIHIFRFLLLIATGTLPIRDGRMGTLPLVCNRMGALAIDC
jgi:hypothetical protein